MCFIPSGVLIKKSDGELFQVLVNIIINLHQKGSLRRFTFVVNEKLPISNLHYIFKVRIIFYQRLVHLLKTFKTIVYDCLFVLLVEQV